MQFVAQMNHVNLRQTQINPLTTKIDEVVVRNAPKLLRGICHDALDSLSGDNYEVLPDSKVHGANMGPIWCRQDPGPMLAPWTLLSGLLSNYSNIGGFIMTYSCVNSNIFCWLYSQCKCDHDQTNDNDITVARYIKPEISVNIHIVGLLLLTEIT